MVCGVLAVAEYGGAIEQGSTMPSLVVSFDGADFWLADDFYRYHACRAAGANWVASEVPAKNFLFYGTEI